MNVSATAVPTPAEKTLADGGAAQVSTDFLKATAADDSPGGRLARAVARLESSRATLRAAMMPPPQEQPTSAGFQLPRRWRAMWRAWTRSGPLALVAGTALGAVRSWWRSQPWYATTEWAGRAVMAETTPIIRRHPFWAMALGLGAGAALVAARPWRWSALNRRVRPLGGRILGWAMAQLSQVPVQMALAALLAQFVGDRARKQGDAATPAAKSSSEASSEASRAPMSTAEPGAAAHPRDVAQGRPDPGAADATVH